MRSTGHVARRGGQTDAVALLGERDPVGVRDSASHRVPLVASLLAVGAGVVWSFGAITANKADGADTFQYLIWRSVAIIVVIELIARWRRKPVATLTALRGDRTLMLACGALLLASIAFVYALKNTAPANAAFLASITPLIAVVLARLVLGERLTAVTVAAVAVALAGVALTVVGDLEAGNMVGNIAAVSSAFGMAGYTVLVRTDLRRDWSPVLPGYAVLMIVICAIVTVAGGRPLVPPIGDIGLAVLHGGVFIVVGTLLFNHASRQVPAVAMTVFALSEMVFVPAWALLFLDRTPTAVSLVGGVVILVAVVGKALLDARRVL